VALKKELVFKQIPLFATLAPGEVAALAARAVEKRFAPGEVLFREGEPSSGIFLLGEGSVKIYKT
jgi:CRP-like cAMP-binding protein